MNRRPERLEFLRNAASSYGQRGLVGLSALVLTPYLFRTLGVDGFGTWSVMFTLTTIFLMLEVGFSAGATKFVAQYRAENRPSSVATTVGASVMLMAGLGVIALCLSVLLGTLASGLAAPDEREAFRTGMLVLGVAILLRYPLAAYGAALIGYQRYDLYSAGQAFMIACFTVGAVIAVEAGAGVLGVAVAYSVGLVAGAVMFMPLLRRADPTLALRPRRGDSAQRHRLMTFSSFSLLADGMIFIGSRMDTVVIAAILNAAAAAPFAAAVKLQTALQTLSLPVLNLLMPMVSELWGRDQDATIRRRFTLATRATAQVTIPLAVGVALFASDIVETWLGPTAPAVTATIIAILAIQTIMLSAVPADKVLIGIGRVRVVGGINVVEGAINLAISVALVSAYGAIGAAIGTLASSALIGPTKFPLACRALGCPTLAFMRSTLGAAIVSSAPATAAMVGIWLLFEPSAGRLLAGLVIGVAISSAVALAQVGPSQLRGVLRNLRSRDADTVEPVEPEAAFASLK